MKRLNLIIYLVAVLALVLIINNAGKFLVINEPPEKADVIIVLSGGLDATTQLGIDLYHQAMRGIYCLRVRQTICRKPR